MRTVAGTACLALLTACEVVVGDGGAGGGTGGAGGAGAATGAAGAGGGTGGAGAATGAGGGMAGTTGAAGSDGGGTTGASTNPLTQSQIDAFVTAHNQARSGPLNPMPSPALPPVSWDPILADSAYNYTSRCAGDGDLLPHNANRSTDYRALGGTDSYVGENIFGKTSTTITNVAAEAVDLWMDEASSYNYAANNIGDAGHYTQVVWRASVRIGCAVVDCPNLRFRTTVLCDYAPGGNITNQKPY